MSERKWTGGADQKFVLKGRFATRPWSDGDDRPDVGSMALVSGANCDVDSDQHRSYMWMQVVGYTDDGEFVCLQVTGCWPVVEHMPNCWFDEETRAALQRAEGEGQ